jgi:hypothetical protein
MINLSNIDSICRYLDDRDIINFHKTTRFYTGLSLWYNRIFKTENINGNEFLYAVDNFPIENLELDRDLMLREFLPQDSIKKYLLSFIKQNYIDVPFPIEKIGKLPLKKLWCGNNNQVDNQTIYNLLDTLKFLHIGWNRGITFINLYNYMEDKISDMLSRIINIYTDNNIILDYHELKMILGAVFDMKGGKKYISNILVLLQSEVDMSLLTLSHLYQDEEKNNKSHMINDIYKIKESLKNNGFDTSNIPYVNENSSLQEIKYAYAILKKENNENRFKCMGEEIARLAEHYSSESSSYKKRGSWEKSNIIEWDDTVKNKLRQIRYDAAPLVQDTVKKYKLSLLMRLTSDLLPSALLLGSVHGHTTNNIICIDILSQMRRIVKKLHVLEERIKLSTNKKRKRKKITDVKNKGKRYKIV